MLTTRLPYNAFQTVQIAGVYNGRCGAWRTVSKQAFGTPALIPRNGEGQKLGDFNMSFPWQRISHEAKCIRRRRPLSIYAGPL